jgi:parallel beta-helix repeat protein
MREIITPEDFGAVGDGTTDDTGAVQAAITASVGKRLVLNQTYVVSGLTIPSNSTITGNGALKRKTAATGYLISGSAAANVTLRGFTVDGNSATGDASALIRFSGASDDLAIDGLLVKNGAHDCISIAGGVRARITNNRCISSRVGIVIATTGGYHVISGNECRGGSASGILIAAPYSVVEGNRCIGNGTGLTQQAGILMSSCLYPIVNDNLCQGNGAGVYFSHGIQFNGCTNGVMSGNVSIGNNGSGLDIYSSAGCTCSGNQALSNNLRGIEVDTASSYAAIVGNIVQGNQETGVSVFNTIGAVVTDNTVSGNGTLGTATNPLTGVANKPYGISLLGAGNYGNYANVSNNVISANVGSGANGVGLYIDPSCIGVTLKGNLVTANTTAATLVAANMAFAGQNQGLYFEQSGSAAIASGTTSIAVTFPSAMSVTPTSSQVTLTALNAGTNAFGELYPTNVTASGLTIHCRSDPGAGGVTVAWRVRCTA